MKKTANYNPNTTHAYTDKYAFDASKEILTELLKNYDDGGTVNVNVKPGDETWQIGFYEGIPVLAFTALCNDRDEADAPVVRYLALFRGYKIQASGTFDGVNDVAGTTVDTRITKLVETPIGQWAFAELASFVIKRARGTHTIKNLDLFNAWLELTFQYMQQNLEFFAEHYHNM